MNEAAFWRKIHRGMKDRWHATRHEDAHAGVPDVSFGLNGVNGWMELKYIVNYDKHGRAEVKTLSVGQRQWLTSRGRRARAVWLLVGVEMDVFLIRGQVLPKRIILYGESPFGIKTTYITGAWHREINFDQFARTIIT